jgi:hypothetical protein
MAYARTYGCTVDTAHTGSWGMDCVGRHLGQRRQLALHRALLAGRRAGMASARTGARAAHRRTPRLAWSVGNRWFGGTQSVLNPGQVGLGRIVERCALLLRAQQVSH